MFRGSMQAKGVFAIHPPPLLFFPLSPFLINSLPGYNLKAYIRDPSRGAKQFGAKMAPELADRVLVFLLPNYQPLKLFWGRDGVENGEFIL